MQTFSELPRLGDISLRKICRKSHPPTIDHPFDSYTSPPYPPEFTLPPPSLLHPLLILFDPPLPFVLTRRRNAISFRKKSKQ